MTEPSGKSEWWWWLAFTVIAVALLCAVPIKLAFLLWVAG